MDSFIRALPSIKTPLQGVAFVAALAVAALSIWRTRRYAILLGRIQKLRPADRKAVILSETCQPVPPEMTAEEFLRYKRQQNNYVLLFAGILSVTLAILFGKAIRAGTYVENVGSGATVNIDVHKDGH